jgi:amidase
MAGPDGYDLRQADAKVKPYRAELDAGVSGLRVGILEEAFGVEGQLIEVEEKVRGAADSLAALGAKVSSVSVPMHQLAGSIGFGTLQAMLFDPFFGGGFGLGPDNLQVTSYVDRARSVWDYADTFPTQLKTLLLTMEHVRAGSGYHYVARARNLTRQLRAQYDDALSEVDLLLLPTIPATAPPIPEADATPAVMYQTSYSLLTHTFGFNVTHHPALTVPCGMVDGLPVGLMLVGRHWDEPTVYRAAYAFEAETNWRTR